MSTIYFKTESVGILSRRHFCHADLSPPELVSKVTPPEVVSKVTPPEVVSKVTPPELVSKVTPPAE